MESPRLPSDDPSVENPCLSSDSVDDGSTLLLLLSDDLSGEDSCLPSSGPLVVVVDECAAYGRGFSSEYMVVDLYLPPSPSSISANGSFDLCLSSYSSSVSTLNGLPTDGFCRESSLEELDDDKLASV
ncbi:hypothetical protein OIU85_030076 [Salix viminalis]|uniref:Uncharacterized protein n=1 Tax=Salix viminalis TaxID=40686 RepID=A0A9Q0QD89_SALVM|nr:hypothetical protein OIU85_030076 [Salix viminalis]